MGFFSEISGTCLSHKRYVSCDNSQKPMARPPKLPYGPWAFAPKLKKDIFSLSLTIANTKSKR